MAYTTINKGSSYFNTVLYTGNGTVESDTQAITGVGFSPDWVWIKERSGTDFHILNDSVRGVGRYLITNTSGAEGGGGTAFLDSFDADGFTVNCDEGGNIYNTSVNGIGQTQVSWSWRGSDSSAVSNTSGTITSTVSANTTAGFSIVSYTGNGTGTQTVGHGLGAVPRMFIIKSRTTAVNWRVYNASVGNTAGLTLNATNGSDVNSGFFQNTTPTSTVFTLGDGSTVNGSGANYIAYCFAEVKGFSKFGGYTGNGVSGNGTFIYTGFRPAFVMIKETSGIDGWGMFDNKRVPYNNVNTHVQAQSSSADITNTADAVDFLSNGFKVATGTSSANFINESGASYIYMAFAENPFVTSGGIPVTAR